MTINDRTDGPSYIFNCNCWIGKEKNDLQKTLTPEKHGQCFLLRVQKFSRDDEIILLA